MKRYRHHFTLNEMLIAVGLLVILAVVLLQIFGAASTLWTASNEQGQLYGDAKIALSVLTDDLENMVNCLPDADGTSQVVIPFTATFDTAGLDDTLLPSSLLDYYYDDNGDLAAPYLLFVTRTLDLMNGTPLTQIRPALVIWCFIPPQIVANGNSKIIQADTGVLRRAVIPFSTSANDFEKRLISTKTNLFNEQLNILSLTSGSYPYRNVIEGVLNVQFRVYSGSNSRPNALYNGSTTAGNSNTTGSNATATKGMENVNSIQVVLTMMAKPKMLELETLTSDAERIEFIRQHSRTLTKTITLGGEFK